MRRAKALFRGANVVTSIVGALVQVIDYFPFGSVRVDDQSASYDSTQKFTGHELDDASGLYYAQARYYDAEIGRFISQDPLQMKPNKLLKKFQSIPQALNFYSYSANNPIIMIDPTGEAIQVGISIEGTTGFGILGGGVSIGLVSGEDGSLGVAITTSAGTGSGTPGFSMSLFSSLIGKENISAFSGTDVNAGVSVCNTLCGGIEVSKPISDSEETNEKDEANEYTGSVGLGISSVTPGIKVENTTVFEIIQAPPMLINAWTINSDGSINMLDYGDPNASIPEGISEKTKKLDPRNTIELRKSHSD